MPYRISPDDSSVVEHEKDSRWSVKQRCSSPENAKAAMRLLQMKEHGVTPEGGWRNERGQRVTRGLKR